MILLAEKRGILMVKPMTFSWRRPFSYCVGWLYLVLAIPSWCGAYDVTVLLSSNIEAYQEASNSFRLGMEAEATLTTATLSSRPEENRLMGERIRASAPDLVFTVGLKATLIAKQEIIDTPILFCLVLYPTRHGIPAPNMYGITMSPSIPTQLHSMKTLLPKLTRVGILYNASRSERWLEQAQNYAKKVHLTLVAHPVNDERMVPMALRTLLPQVDLLWLTRDPTIVNIDSTPFILETAMEHDVPIHTFSKGMVRHGAFASLSPDFRDIGAQASRVAKNLLLTPPHQPTQHLLFPEQAHLTLNIQTAESLGLMPPPAALKLAEVIFGGKPSVIVQDDIQNEATTIENNHIPSTMIH